MTSTQFKDIALSAFDGLRDFYPHVLTERTRDGILTAVEQSCTETDDEQADYVALRDAIEKVANEITNTLDDEARDQVNGASPMTEATKQQIDARVADLDRQPTVPNLGM